MSIRSKTDIDLKKRVAVWKRVATYFHRRWVESWGDEVRSLSWRVGTPVPPDCNHYGGLLDSLVSRGPTGPQFLHRKVKRALDRETQRIMAYGERIIRYAERLQNEIQETLQLPVEYGYWLREVAAVERNTEGHWELTRDGHEPIRFVTPPITITHRHESVDFGPFAITFPMDREWDNYHGWDFYALDPNERQDYIHPHISDGGLCGGEWGASLNAAMSRGDLSDALELTISILRTYNPSSPYLSLDYWLGRGGATCSLCGDSYDEENEGAYCDDCNHSICDNCAVGCSICDTMGCTNCMTRCRVCRNWICAECQVANRLCRDCASVCEFCGDAYRNTDFLTCQECGVSFCPGCFEDHTHENEDDDEPSEETEQETPNEQPVCQPANQSSDRASFGLPVRDWPPVWWSEREPVYPIFDLNLPAGRLDELACLRARTQSLQARWRLPPGVDPILPRFAYDHYRAWWQSRYAEFYGRAPSENELPDTKPEVLTDGMGEVAMAG